MISRRKADQTVAKMWPETPDGFGSTEALGCVEKLSGSPAHTGRVTGCPPRLEERLCRASVGARGRLLRCARGNFLAAIEEACLAIKRVDGTHWDRL